MMPTRSNIPAEHSASPEETEANRRYTIYETYIKYTRGQNNESGALAERPIAFLLKHDLLSQALDEQIDLCEKYLPYVKAHESSYSEVNLDEILNLIINYPQLAENLYDLFDIYPNLIKPYSNLGSAKHENIHDGEVRALESGYNPNTRISREYSQEEIFAQLERNKQDFESLINLMGEKEWVDIAEIPGLGIVSLQHLNRTTPEIESIRIVCRAAEDVAIYNFGTFEFNLGKNGLLYEQYSSDVGKYPGYFYKQRNEVSERQIMSGVLKFKAGSQEQLEFFSTYKVDGGTVGLMEYAQRTGF